MAANKQDVISTAQSPRRRRRTRNKSETDVSVDDLRDFFEGVERRVPEPPWGLEVDGDLFREPRPAKVMPFPSAARTERDDDSFEPRPEPLDHTALAMEDLSDVFEPPPAPEPWVSVAPQDAVAFDEPLKIEEPPAGEAGLEYGAPPESSVVLLAAGLRQLAVELRDLSASPF